ncbi:NUDIX hydrolase [Candidatus Woesearchaeota archaeon]|jgi:8-oxo-dGTP diphosphatase|nr:NUDIX hydrolase [Candidatus Woesearchaeota archaeon]
MANRKKVYDSRGHDNPGNGVGVIIPNPNNPDEIVMTLRTAETTNSAGMWELPGGKQDLFETIYQAGSRETFDEVGLEVCIKGCIDICDLRIEGQHWMNYTVVAEVKGGELTNKEDLKFDEVRYMNIHELPENTALLAIRGIRNYITKRQHLEYILIETVVQD